MRGWVLVVGGGVAFSDAVELWDDESMVLSYSSLSDRLV